MKKLFKLLSLLTVAGFILASCEGPMGQTGANGKDGTDGIDGSDGKDGVDANASCLKCHTMANTATKEAEYHLSKHFTGSTSARNGKYCARCHTNQGFQEVVGNGKLVVVNDIPNGTRVNCETCHKHNGFDFTADTLTEILSTTSPVFLHYNNPSITAVPTVSTDFGKINNLCATCHQIRGATATVYSDTTKNPDVINAAWTQLPYFPIANTDDNAPVKYLVGRSFSVHDGNQSNLFAGKNGYEYVGKTYTRTWEHSDFTCTDCHMNTYNATTKTGGHTLIVNQDACNTCHGNDTKISTVQSLIDAKRIEMAELLVARKVFKKTGSGATASYSAMNTHDFNGKLFPTTQTPGDLFAKNNTANTVSPTTGLVVYGVNITYAADADYAFRIGRDWKYGEFGAAYNYAYINSELSKGVHNPTYALQLLQNSIDWLNAN